MEQGIRIYINSPRRASIRPEDQREELEITSAKSINYGADADGTFVVIVVEGALPPGVRGALVAHVLNSQRHISFEVRKFTGDFPTPMLHCDLAEYSEEEENIDDGEDRRLETTTTIMFTQQSVSPAHKVTETTMFNRAQSPGYGATE